MNYLAYVLAAYTVAFVLISVMFAGSYRRYKNIKHKYTNKQESKL